MLHIILAILKIVGILLAVLLLLVLLAIGSVLFVPLRYRVSAAKDESGIRAWGKINWLFHLISANIEFRDGKPALQVRILFLKKNLLSGEEEASGEAKEKRFLRKGKKKNKPEAEGKNTEKKISPEKKKESRIPTEERGEKRERAEKKPEKAAENPERTMEKPEKAMEKPEAIEKPERATEKPEVIEKPEKAMEKPEAIEKPELLTENKKGKTLPEQAQKTPELLQKAVKSKRLQKGLESDRPESKKKKASFLKVFMDRIRSLIAKGRELLEKLRAIPQKIRQLGERLKPTWQKIKDWISFLLSDLVKAEVGRFKQHFLYLWKHLRPDKIWGDVQYGVGDPALTGQLTGVLYMLLPARCYDIRLNPDFEHAVCKGEIHIKGHIRLCHLARIGWKVFRDKEFRKVLKKIQSL